MLTLPALLERVASLPVTYKDDLGGALAALSKQAYQAVCQTQGASKGEVQGDNKAEKALRKAGARQLKLNLLDRVKLHIDEPDTVRALYDPKIFTQPTKAAQPKV